MILLAVMTTMGCNGVRQVTSVTPPRTGGDELYCKGREYRNLLAHKGLEELSARSRGHGFAKAS